MPIRQVGLHQVTIRQLGANVGGSAPIVAPVPAGSPLVWYDVLDMNGSSNLGLVDGASIAAYKNKGTLGSAWDCTTGSATLPKFKKIGTPGAVNNLPMLSFDGTQWIATAVNAAQATTFTIAALFLATDLAAARFVIDGGTGGRAGWDVEQTTGLITLTGSGVFTTNKSIAAQTYNLVVANYAPATSSLRLNGSTSNSGNPIPAGLTGVTLGGFIGGGALWKGLMGDVLVYADGTSNAAIESYYVGKFGATPQ